MQGNEMGYPKLSTGFNRLADMPGGIGTARVA
jgi:hypothetical protein